MRFGVVVLAVAAVVGVPAASATGRTYVGPAQVEPSASPEQMRADVHAWCVRKWPALAGTTAGPLFIDDARTTATLTISSAEVVGTCGFSPGAAQFSTADPLTDDMAGRKISSLWLTRGGTDASGNEVEVHIARVAPDVTSVEAHLRDGRTVTAVVEAEMAVLVVPEQPNDTFLPGRVVVRDASGVVYDGPI